MIFPTIALLPYFDGCAFRRHRRDRRRWASFAIPDEKAVGLCWLGAFLVACASPIYRAFRTQRWSGTADSKVISERACGDSKETASVKAE